MENNNTCEGFLCSLADKCNKEGSCKLCDSYCSCTVCIFDYVPNDDKCYMDFQVIDMVVGCKCDNCSIKKEWDKSYGAYYCYIECLECNYYWEGYINA